MAAVGAFHVIVQQFFIFGGLVSTYAIPALITHLAAKLLRHESYEVLWQQSTEISMDSSGSGAAKKFEWDFEPDAFTLLFEHIYQPGEPRLNLKVLVGTAGVSVQLLACGFIICSFHGWLGADMYWHPHFASPDDTFTLVARSFAFFLLLWMTFPDVVRNSKFSRLTCMSRGGFVGNLFAHLLVFMSHLSVVTTWYTGAVLIVSTETVIDTFKDFAALAFLIDIDNWAAALLPSQPDTSTIDWSKLPLRESPQVLLKILHSIEWPSILAYGGFLAYYWIPVNSIEDLEGW